MSAQEVFGGWSTTALEEYLEENGAAVPPGATKQQLVDQCWRVSKQIESQVLTRASHGGPPHRAPPGSQPPAQSGQVPPPMPPAGGPRKKALIIGVNYFGTRSQLNGCINDARCMQYLLEHRMGFPQNQILLMADDHPDPMRRPTRYNIYQGITWLMTGLQTGDSLVFHFSGHGSQQRDRTGQELDGMNETICPMDFQQAGEIVDDELNRMLINPLPTGVKLHAVIDACHSGSACDLPFQAVVSPQGIINWHSEYHPSMLRTWKGTAGGFAVQISAAMDHETAADTAKFSGIHTGAATYSFIRTLEERGLNISYGDLLLGMHRCLMAVNGGAAAGGGGMGGLGGMLNGLLGSAMGGSSFRGQSPVLSAGYTFDLATPFRL